MTDKENKATKDSTKEKIRDRMHIRAAGFSIRVVGWLALILTPAILAVHVFPKSVAIAYWLIYIPGGLYLLYAGYYVYNHIDKKGILMLFTSGGIAIAMVSGLIPGVMTGLVPAVVLGLMPIFVIVDAVTNYQRYKKILSGSEPQKIYNHQISVHKVVVGSVILTLLSVVALTYAIVGVH